MARLRLGIGSPHLAFGWHWLHAFALAGENQGAHEPPQHPDHHGPPNRPRPRPGPRAFLTLYAALVAYLLIWTYRGGDWLRAAAWATTGLLLATAWLLPWYLLWPLPAQPYPATGP